ncbi:MAG TPA: hypothetical protein VI959_04190 [Alphaproteobacteria bacterium]|nr:hypothetical protein [Alphaproteobacteria bacterium]
MSRFLILFLIPSFFAFSTEFDINSDGDLTPKSQASTDSHDTQFFEKKLSKISTKEEVENVAKNALAPHIYKVLQNLVEIVFYEKPDYGIEIIPLNWGNFIDELLKKDEKDQISKIIKLYNLRVNLSKQTLSAYLSHNLEILSSNKHFKFPFSYYNPLEKN